MSVLKRAFDVAIASTTLVATAPLMALIAAAIKLESPGPVLFSQIRVGRDRRPIRALKLRTMIVDAQHLGPEITADADPRITRIGRWLRKTKLDELPQLVNVLRGEMSVVGPRPEVPRYASTYRPEWERLFTVRPGLTDLASLTFRDEERLLAAAIDREKAYTEIIMPMKLQLALDGVMASSLQHDLGVIVRTAVALVLGRDKQQEFILDQVRTRIAELNRTHEDL